MSRHRHLPARLRLSFVAASRKTRTYASVSDAVLSASHARVSAALWVRQTRLTKEQSDCGCEFKWERCRLCAMACQQYV